MPCVYVSFKRCNHEGKTSEAAYGASKPTSSGTFISPAALATFEGFGLETIYWNEAEVSVVTGNGRIGAGVSSANSDDTFFGNTAKEYSVDYENRVLNGEQKYDFTKYSVATGIAILSNKKKTNTLNLGVVFKHINRTSNTYFGLGTSLTLGPLSLGATRFRDEGIASSLNSLGARDAEIYYVNTFNVGLHFHYISFDYTSFTSEFSSDASRVEEVEVYSTGLSLKEYILSYGRRLEQSQRRKYDYDNKFFKQQTKSWRTFYGFQYQLLDSWVAGVLYNYYLHNEYSFVLTGFF